MSFPKLAALLALGLFTLQGCDDSRKRGAADGGPGTLTDGSATATDGPNGAYLDLGDTDSGICKPGQTANMCPMPLPSTDGCVATEDCGPNGTGNGLDDNCNGVVDETCSCTPGNVEKCFLGPPGKHNIGGCTDGQQTCSGGEFGGWGKCTGSIGPGAETCDGIDNDCNGCADDGLCCDSSLTCPGSVPDVEPYTDVSYMGASYFHGTAVTWAWTVTGGPCDQLFETTTGTPPVQSFTVTGADTSTPTIHFTLSGDYTVTMTVTDGSGHKSVCTWVQHVAGPGVRVELCWDTTGSSDLDLHLHKPNSTTDFFGPDEDNPSGDDCNFSNCKAEVFTSGSPPNWGYANSPIAACVGGPEGAEWQSEVGSCRNPRLDIDDIDTAGVPENINVDKPNSGDSFRVLVHYYGAGFSTQLTSHPMVNIYCGGRLKTTYGQSPDQVMGFAKAGGWAAGDMWRVADVVPMVDSSGTTTDCTVTAIHPANMTSGYLVGHDGKTSFTGN